MKGFKGTKGKWSAESLNDGSDLHAIFSAKTNTLIARTCYMPFSKANAQLISKAPEMLALLQGIAEEICTLLDDEDLTDDKLREFSELTLPNIHLQILTQIKQATEV